MSRIATNRAQRSVPVPIPAPTGGLNGRDGQANMPALDALVLDNWFPNSTTVDTRGGSLTWATGLGASVESLETYAGGSTPKMLAFAGGKVFAVPATGVPGAVGAPLATGKLSNRIAATMFSNAGAQFLVGVSGADAPFSYDGTTFNTLTITGLTGSQNTLQNIFAFKARLYLVQQGQLGFYYLGVGAIQGAASYFDLSQVAKSGGYLVGIASFSSDSGTGLHDYIVFMTSRGEYIVYEGTDPSNAATWSLVSRYYASPPIGRKGWFNFRSDLYLITAEGILSFAELRSNGATGDEQEFLTGKLGTHFTDLTVFKNTYGWSAFVYPPRGQLIVNVPAFDGEQNIYYQFAMNTATNAWGCFKGWNGVSWAYCNDRAYFGTADGRVVLSDEGALDDGKPIKCDARQAFNYFDDGKGMGAADKHFHFATFVVTSDGTPPLSATMNVNFEDSIPAYVIDTPSPPGAVWDVAQWDIDFWAGTGEAQTFTIPVGKIGYVGSVWLRAYLQTTAVKWFATRITCERVRGIILL